VRELVIILADFFLREVEGGSPRARAALTRARFGPARAVRGGWRDWLARRERREDLGLADPAAVVAAALRRPSPASLASPACDSSAWLVTPLHLLAGMKTVHVPMNACLSLTPAESRALVLEFAALFGADGLALQATEPSGFLLYGLAAEGAVTIEPARLLGGTLDEGLPSGPGSRRLRQIMTEIDLWLHELPLNRAREARNEPRISTLWLWGGGQPLRDTLPRSAPYAGWAAVHAEDAWVSAFGQFSGIAVHALPRDAAALLASSASAGAAPPADGAVCVIVPCAAQGLAVLDAAWIQPAVAAVRGAVLRGVSIVGNDRCVTLTAGDQWRLWRPPRDVLTALAEGAA
jgi:hypothetical protein